MIAFHFELCPLEDVAPWGGDEPMLHWFGLTEGRYWLEVNGYELLRRNASIDYYVARLWEDVVGLTPDVLEPVPADLVQFIASDRAEWAFDPLDVVAEPEPGAGEAEHPAVTASIWYGEHVLDLGYIQNPPRLRWWRTVHDGGDEITVDWRYEEDGLRSSVPTSAYHEAVHALDRELMLAMGQRVEELVRRDGLPGVALDLSRLRQEHEDRQHWLTRNLDRTPTTAWDAVRQGASLLLGA